MAIEVFNRREIKYKLTDEIYRKLRNVLDDYMEVDAFSRNGEFYTICNVYYDTLNSDLIRTSMEKPTYKEKLRLRSYGVASQNDKVYLEIKKKFNGRVYKRRTSLNLEEAYRYFDTGEKPKPKSYLNRQVFNEIDYMTSRHLLRPTIYLSYDRNAYFSKEDRGFRITFDTNIRTRRTEVGLDLGNYGEPILEPGIWIMEAKAEGAVPMWFSKLLSANSLYPSSFSKYGTEYKINILGMEVPGMKI